MIRITQIKLKIDDDLKLLSKKISKILGISENEFTYKVVRRSIDARKGDVNYVNNNFTFSYDDGRAFHAVMGRSRIYSG